MSAFPVRALSAVLSHMSHIALIIRDASGGAGARRQSSSAMSRQRVPCRERVFLRQQRGAYVRVYKMLRGANMFVMPRRCSAAACVVPRKYVTVQSRCFRVRCRSASSC